MILTEILRFFVKGICGIISLVNIPFMPDDVIEGAHEYLDLIMENSSLLGLFVKWSTIKSTALLLIVIWQFENIWKIGNYLWNKLPFVNSSS